RRRPTAVCAAVLATAVGLSGCGLLDFPTFPLSKSTQTASASPTRTPIPPRELDVGTIVATGQLVGDPLISGDVDVRVTGKGTYELRLLNFTSGHGGDVELLWSPHVVQPGDKCTTSIMTMSYGNLPVGTHQQFPVLKDFTHGDPSFLDTVIISRRDPLAFQNGCYVSILASAILTWTIPDIRPGLVVVDSGWTGGATGDVTLLDGSPIAYTVASGDLAAEVAARFGITVSDLFYLNPIRIARVRYPLLEAGEVLNLSKAHR
ncbi:MAG: LysM domain-containing protein, partial [Microterricola sp.]